MEIVHVSTPRGTDTPNSFDRYTEFLCSHYTRYYILISNYSILYILSYTLLTRPNELLLADVTCGGRGVQRLPISASHYARYCIIILSYTLLTRPNDEFLAGVTQRLPVRNGQEVDHRYDATVWCSIARIAAGIVMGRAGVWCSKAAGGAFWCSKAAGRIAAGIVSSLVSMGRSGAAKPQV